MKPPLFENCRAYLLAHSVSPPRDTRRPTRRAVTISRETGAGAISVGKCLMEFLERHQGGDAQYPWAVFDRELVKRVLLEHNLPEKIETYLPEDSPSRVNDVIEDLLGLHPSQWTLVQHTNHTILRLALSGNAIVVGRGGSLVTANLSQVLHVRLVAPLEFRIDHVRDYYGLSPDEAHAFVRNEDRARARYVRRHFRADVQSPLHYHLVLNTGLLGFDEAAHIIGNAVLHHTGHPTPVAQSSH